MDYIFLKNRVVFFFLNKKNILKKGVKKEKYLDYTAIIVAISFYGSFLNARKKRGCFVMWITSGLLWAIVDVLAAKYWRMLLDLVQVSFSIYGLWNWKRKEVNTKNPSKMP